MSKHGCVLLCTAVLLMCGALHAAKGGNKPSSSDTGSSKDSSSTSNTSASSDSGGDQGGVTGGGFAIESEMFAYKALMANSEEIADEVANILAATASDEPGKALPADDQTVVIITDQDMKNYLVMRSFVAQCHILKSRTERFLKNVRLVERPQYVPPPSPPAPKKSQNGGKAGDTSFQVANLVSLSSVQTSVGVLKDVLGIFAVSQSVSGVRGTIKDAPLINMVGRELASRKIRVLVPSTYTPGAFGSDDLSNTILQTELDSLEHLRADLSDELHRLGPFLHEAGGIINDDKASGENKKKAQAFTSDTYAAGLADAIAQIDAFVGALFGASVSAKAAKVDTSRNSTSPDDSSGPAKPAASFPGDPPVAAILAGASLQRAIWGAKSPDLDNNSTHVLALQSLESGGGVLTKANLFSGKHLFFSGGAVSTFSLFKMSGELECSGNVTAYEDYVGADKVLRKVQANDINLKAQLLRIRSNCKTKIVKYDLQQ